MNESAATPVLNMALEFYTGKPCRICGRPLTAREIRNGQVVDADYSADGEKRAAHKACFGGFATLCEELGIDWRGAVVMARRGTP